MIVGVGFDLEDIEDFGRTLTQSGEAFLKRVYTEREIEYCQSQPHAGQSYAARYAAKEAAMKALGIAGMEGLKWRDFEVVSTTGPPQILLHGVAAAEAKQNLDQVMHELSAAIHMLTARSQSIAGTRGKAA